MFQAGHNAAGRLWTYRVLGRGTADTEIIHHQRRIETECGLDIQIGCGDTLKRQVLHGIEVLDGLLRNSNGVD